MAELLALLTISIMPKNINMNLAYGLSHKEFKCQCKRKECHYTLYSKRLTSAYHKVRKNMAVPLRINSGFRCQLHNTAIGGVNQSSHTTGHAIDISFKGLTHDQKKQLIELCRKYFDYVQIYSNFIHCQINA